MTEYLLDHQWMFIRHIPVSKPYGTAFAVKIVFPDDLSMLAITLTAPPHCSHVSISIPKNRLILCAQVIDWCFCARVFPILCIAHDSCMETEACHICGTACRKPLLCHSYLRHIYHRGRACENVYLN
jgi:hypothetical protein